MNLLVTLSTKGHGWGTDRVFSYNIYKSTIPNLINQCGGDLKNVFKNNILSLKVFHGDDDRANEYIEYFKNLDFKIILHKNEDSSITDDTVENMHLGSNRYKYMIGNYLNDLKTTFSLLSNFDEEFTFLYEDDCPVIIESGKSLLDYLNKTKEALNQEQDLVTVAFVRRIWGERKLTPKAYYKISKTSVRDGLIRDGYWFNFQPGVRRTKDLIGAGKIITDNWNTHFMHADPESGVSQAIEAYKGLKIKSYGFPVEECYSMHLGEKCGGTIETRNDNLFDD
jgi:hypothetical protein